MPKRRAVTLYQHNAEQIDVTVTDGADAYDLTDVQVEVYLKPSAATDDDDAAVVLLAIGTGVELLDAAAGQVRVTVPPSALTTSGTRWWRLDVVKDAARRTAVYGPMHVTDI